MFIFSIPLYFHPSIPKSRINYARFNCILSLLLAIFLSFGPDLFLRNERDSHVFAPFNLLRFILSKNNDDDRKQKKTFGHRKNAPTIVLSFLF